MADISDVSTALGQLIGATLYPSGASGEAASPVAGLPVRVENGWPSPQSLDGAIAAGKAHVSIYPRPGDRDTTRTRFDWEEQPIPAATYTLAQAGQTVTVGGAAPVTYFAQNLAVFVNGVAYVTTATTGQAVNSLAAALQALIVVGVPGTTVSGAVVTLPAGARIGALRVGVTGTATKTVGTEEKVFQISIWANNPTNRVAVASAIDPVLRDTPRLTLPDGSIARVKHVGGTDNDFDQKQGIWRRDLLFSVEFASVRTMSAPQIVAEITQLADPQANIIATITE